MGDVLDFTSEQEAFLQHDPTRHGRLIAGPGAGKSTTCVAYIANHSNIEVGIPTRIRMLTFTRAATAEFADKMRAHGLPTSIPAPTTIHAFALRILHELEWPKVPQPVRLADDWETQTLIRPQLSRLLRAQNHKSATPSVIKALEREMAAQFESLDESPIYAHLDPALGAAYIGLWTEHRTRHGYLLLSELPYRAATAIEDMGVPSLDADLLLVDEYQDLNHADIRLLRLLAARAIAIVAIGDPDQSIYRFRKAAPEGIQRFLKEFDATDDYRLTLSRRCGRSILATAQKLIDAAPRRMKQPAMRTIPEAKPGVSAYLRFESDLHEAEGVAEIVRLRLKAGVPARQIAILARSRRNVWTTQILPSFKQRGIEIASDEWVDTALNDVVLRCTRALARLGVNRGDSLAWWTLMKLCHGIGECVEDAVYHEVQPLETFAKTLERVAGEGLATLKRHQVERLKKRWSEVDRKIPAFRPPPVEQLGEGGWGAWLAERADDSLSDEARRLLKLVSDEMRTMNPNASLETFLNQLDPLGHDFAFAESDAVRFMTMQRSKGLTFDTVIVVGVEDGQVPMPPPKGDPDEERRLLYVAMTRATDVSILTFAKRRTGALRFSGTPNPGPRLQSRLLEGVITAQDADPFIREFAETQQTMAATPALV